MHQLPSLDDIYVSDVSDRDVNKQGITLRQSSWLLFL